MTKTMKKQSKQKKSKSKIVKSCSQEKFANAINDSVMIDDSTSSVKQQKNLKNRKSNVMKKNIDNKDLPKTIEDSDGIQQNVKKQKKLKKKKDNVKNQADNISPESGELPDAKDSGLEISDLVDTKSSNNDDVKSDEVSEEVSKSDGENTEKMPIKKIIKGKSEHRSEPSQIISEFNLTAANKQKIRLDDLIKSSQESTQLSIKKQLQNARKLKSLSIPLSKPKIQKIKRTVAYGKVCGEVGKWDQIVKSNRDAEQMIYPLKRPEIHLESFDSAAERYISKHPVEEAVSKILQKSENVLDQTKTLTVAEEKALQAMSLEEAKLRHNELMKHRALISYQEAKARRQNKIKSKRFHRILKREKLKQMMKEFEELQKTDQQAALEKFVEADKLRILERMTLKHRNTGKWAKQQKIRAKYNPESRSNLKEDLLIGKQLREKVNAEVTAISKLKDFEIDPEDKFFEDSAERRSNLKEDLLIGKQLREKVDAGVISKLKDFEIDPEDKFFEDSTENFLIEDAPFQNKALEAAISNVGNYIDREETKRMETEDSKISQKVTPKPVKITSVEDEMAFSSEAACLESMIPDDITFGDDDLDDKDEDKITINQAFADEELIAEFQEEKKVADKANKIQGIDLFLPGWGTWGGPNIKPSKKRRRRFLIKPLEQPIKKNTLSNVIINEDKDKKASVHQVSHLPFPFSNVQQFESYVRQPIGHTWNPPSSFQRLIAPKVVTKMGKIINPIDPDDVVFQKKTDAVPARKKKQKGREVLKPF